jgi:hypothetical protein
MFTLKNASTSPQTKAEPHFRVEFHPKKLSECRISVDHTMFPSKPARKNADQTNLDNLETYRHPRSE